MVGQANVQPGVSLPLRLLMLRTVLAGYPFVIGVRLFRSFDAQPRLALVTKDNLQATASAADL